MKKQRITSGSRRRAWTIGAAAALALAGWAAAETPATNRVSQTDLEAFQIISQRNIFNQNRTARRYETEAAAAVDSFALVGTFKYPKGDFAFFDGTSAEYRKVLRTSGAIAGYTVTAITPAGVQLERGGQRVAMKVGAHMRRVAEGAWQLAANGSRTTNAAGGASALALPARKSEISGGEASDVLKKLMQRREQELK